MKKRSKRLVINKETLRLLEKTGLDELRKVDGGITFTCPQITCESRCHTECLVPQCA